MAFADEAYWLDNNSSLLSKYGSSNIAFVYDNNSKLYPYVQNYQNYLRNTLGKTSVSATLMSHEQALSLGLEDGKFSPFAWLNQTSFWLGSVQNDMVYRILTGENRYGSAAFSLDYFLGVRPVITISKSEL